ncbi:MAG: SusC/RagA family TonB-linked outer membrane protein, partial [Bacteroidales bacterium 45-6]
LSQPKYTAERINNTGTGRYPSWVYPANDWYKQLFKDATVNHRAGLSVRGGSKIIQYYASLGLDVNEGMLKTDRLNQFDVNINNKTTTLRMNLNIDMTPSSKLTINSNSSLDDYHGPLTSVQGAYGMAFNASPVNYAPVYPADLDSNWPHIHFGFENINSQNPYATIQQGYQETTRFSTTNKLEYIQNLGMFLKGLELRANLSYYKQSYEMLPFSVKPYKYRLLNYNQQTGEHSLELLDEGETVLKMDPNRKTVYGNTQLGGEFRIMYNGLWGDHNLTYTGLFNIQQQASSAATNLFSSIKHRNMGTSMRLSYGFKERYYLEGSFGYNGSERFAKSNRFGFFPAVGGAWIASKESFIKPSSKWLSYLKLRASYGKVGNDGIGTGDISVYGNTGRYLYLENITQNQKGNYNTVSYANPTIQWEIAEQANFGLEFALFKGLIDCTVDAYQEIRHNILSQRVVVPATMGLGLYPYSNIGKGRSRGIDFSGKVQHSFNNDCYFILNGTFTYSKAIYLQIEEGANKPSWQRRVGHDVSQQIGYIAEGLFQSQEEIDRSPKQSGNVMPGDIKYRDINGDGKISVDDATYIGYPTSPRFVYGFSAFVYWKRLEFSAAFQGSGQRSLFMNPVALGPFYGDHALLKEIWDNHWTPDNMQSKPFWPRLSTNAISTHNMEEGGYGQESPRYSTYFMRPVRFLRCQQIMLAYSLPQKWVSNMGMQRVKPYVSVDNPFIISSFKLWDVELGSSGFNYPIQRTFSIGLNVSF